MLMILFFLAPFTTTTTCPAMSFNRNCCNMMILHHYWTYTWILNDVKNKGKREGIQLIRSRVQSTRTMLMMMIIDIKLHLLRIFDARIKPIYSHLHNFSNELIKFRD